MKSKLNTNRVSEGGVCENKFEAIGVLNNNDDAFDDDDDTFGAC